jgi:hypothetical protein
MNARAIGLLLASLCANCALSGLAWGQTGAVQPPAALDVKPIGKILEATGSATIEHTSGVVLQANLPASGPGQAKVDDLVYQGDVVQTAADGALSITFIDGTSFKISSNARMELNELVYDPKSNSNSMLFSLDKGAFTFLAGMVAKTGNMKVDTPVATMGIRGTAPHVEIADDGTVKFSTLIEENKSAKEVKKVVPQAVPAPPQRRTQNLPSPDTAAQQRAEKEASKKLTICRGC